uniref:HAT C-terminal dimerisation domain-containing protein n=1 Tax=Latimeria chalumnae TaxID=7897 RepID=H2ZUC8_LATCH
MSGKYKGIQSYIKKTEYILCSAHSLNLVGNTATSCCTDAISFFGIVQKLYNFLSSSTYRSLKVNYKEVIETLGILCNDEEQNNDTRAEAGNIISKLSELVNYHVLIWGDILERMNKVNELLQSESLTLKTVIEHMDSLCEFVKVIRKDFDTYKKDALRHKSDGEISYRRTSDRKIKRKPQFDEKEAYRRAMNDFEFIFDYEEDNVSKKRAAAAKLVQKYSKDLEKELENEIIHFHERVKQSQTANDASNVTEAMKTVLSSGCFPNMAIALCIYLSMPCIVCEGERSFSKLTRIKNEKRTTVGQEKLNALSIIAIEWDIARKMDSSNLIREFTIIKNHYQDVK